MNFETISRFHFEPIEKSARYVQEVIRVSGEKVTITSALYERMNSPEFLSFGYDKDNKAIGVLVVNDEQPNVTPLRKEKSGTIRCNNSAFIAKKIYELMNVNSESKSIVLRRGCKVNDYWVFELRYAEVINKNGRKKQS